MQVCIDQRNLLRSRFTLPRIAYSPDYTKRRHLRCCGCASRPLEHSEVIRKSMTNPGRKCSEGERTRVIDNYIQPFELLRNRPENINYVALIMAM